MCKLNLIISTILVCSAVSFNSNADLSSSVKVSVRSSSNYIYPCNAGIAQNPKSISKGVDFIRSSWIPSQHNPSAQASSGIAIGGGLKDNNSDTDFNILSGLIGTGSRPYLSYNQLLPENTMYDFVVGQNINGGGLEVNLSSDTYDSAYYITFCFKPSLVGTDSRIPMSLKFTHAIATHAAVPGVTYNYATDAKLMSMVEIKCSKDNGAIIQHYTPNGITPIDNLLTPFSGNMTIDMAPTAGIQIGNGNSLIDGPALNPGDLPDDCRVRFYFIETSGKLRPHTLSASDIQVDLQATVGTY
jgi:hypothetical protein